MLPRGVVYVGIGGGKYLGEATRSARSLRRHNSRLSITVFTDHPQDADASLFNDVQLIKRPPNGKEMYSKQVAFQRSPYERTLYLDADTYVCGNIGAMFDILDGYDFAAAPAPRRVDPGGFEAYGENIPGWFPEVNGGVLLAKKSAGWDRLAHSWKQAYTKIDRWNDQISLRVALYHEVMEHGLRFYPLLPEFNCRTYMLQFLASKTYILHGRDEDLDQVCSQVNSRTGVRIWMPKHGLFAWKDWEYVEKKA